jgi:type I restriction enzyme R subunit
MNAIIDGPIVRFTELARVDRAEADALRGKVVAFVSLYGFFSQIIPYQDSDLEKLYVFFRHLLSKLPKRESSPSYQFDDDVKLDYYRLQKISEGSISLAEGTAQKLDGPLSIGSKVPREDEVRLSRLIDVVNDRFGTDFNNADQLFFDQLVEAAMADYNLRQAAIANPARKFELLFKNLLEALFVERMDQNEEIFARFMNDKPFQSLVTSLLATEAYSKLRADPEQRFAAGRSAEKST